MTSPITYPTRAKIRRVAEAAREIGLDVAGIEIGPDGSIKILDARIMPSPQPKGLFEELEARGLI